MSNTFINIWDDNKRVYVRRRDGATGKTVVDIHDIDWYFCIRKEDATGKRDELEKLAASDICRYEVDDRAEGFIRVYPKDRRRGDVVDRIRSLGIEPYEGDLKLYQRYLADSDSELELQQSVLYFDIESDDRTKGIEPGATRILSIAAVDSEGNEFFQTISEDTDEEEKKLLKWFLKKVDEYDILEGWFSEGYDLVAIKRRCDLYRLKFDCRIIEESNNDLGGLHSVRKSGKYRARMDSINHIDLMQKMKEMHYRDTDLIKTVRSFSLSAVAKYFLNDDKVDTGGQGFYDMWQNDPEKFKEYNLHDARLLKLLDDKIKITYQKLIEHQILHARINDYTSSKKIDSYALREAQRMGKRLFSANRSAFQADPEEAVISYEEAHEVGDETEEEGKPKKEESKYQGGYVFEPKTGIYENLTVFDFQSLYPSIIKTFNISRDSIATSPEDASIRLPTGVAFKSEKGIIPRIIQSVLDERNRIRFEEMPKYEKGSFEYENAHYKQYSLKVIANSMYGVMGASFSRYYLRECAEGITLTGQYLLKEMNRWMIEDGHEPIYGDTDSLFVVLKNGSDPKEVGARINAYLESHVKEKFNVEENHMNFDYEATYDRFLMQDKKKYVGVKEGKIAKMMGMEAKKRDTLPITERLQKELLNSILLEKHDAQYYKEWLMKQMRYVISGDVPPEELTFQKRLNKEIEGYTGRQADLVHVRVARQIKARVEEKGHTEKKINLFSMGAYIPWIVTDSSGRVVGVHPDEYTKGSYDKRYYWTRAIYPALNRTLSAAFPNVPWDSYEILKPRANRNLLDEIL